MNRTLLFVLAIASSIAGHGQNVDSVLRSPLHDSVKANFVADYTFTMSERNADSGIYYSKIGLRFATASGSRQSQANCLNAAGWAFFRAGKADSGKRYARHAMEIFRSLNSRRNEARAMMNLGEMNVTQNRLDTALSLLMSMQHLLRPQDKFERASSQRLIGIIYRRMGNSRQAKAYLSSAATNFRAIGQDKQYADVMGSVGILFHSEHRFDSALLCFRTALSIYSRLGNSSGVALMYDDLGHVFRVMGKTTPIPWLDSAQYYYEKAYDVFRSMNSKNELPFEKLGMGEVQSLKGDTLAALSHYFEALKGFISLHDHSNVHDILLTLSQLYAGLGEYKDAYRYMDMSHKYQDTLQQESRSREVAEILEKYESGKKDSLIRLLDENNKLLSIQASLARANVNKNRVIVVFVVVAALLAGTLGFVLWNRYRMKQRLEAVQLRNRISSDLHDDVGSSLSSILMLSNIGVSADAGNKGEILDKISVAARDVADRMGDIVWATNPRYDEGESLRAKVMNYVAFLNQSEKTQIKAVIAEDVSELRLHMYARRNIFLVIKEAVNNALKYAEAKNIIVQIRRSDRHIELDVVDDGKGFELAAVDKGNGLHSMRERVAGTGGKLAIRSSPGNGTTIAASIPIAPRKVQNKKRGNGKKQRKE